LSGLPLAQFWERGTEGVRAEMCVHGSLEKERFDKTLIPLLSKERLGEVLPDQTKLQFST